MANSRFEYVKKFEQPDHLLLQCWIVIRVDGKGFTKFAALHDFEKPSDARALALMDASAKEVMQAFPDIRIAFGQSDEYSFIFAKSTQLYGRRGSKLLSLVVSLFTGSYVAYWSKYFPDKSMQQTPMFDGRCICYPNDTTLRDYLSWRQADTHINNQYNTCFWALVKSGMSQQEAQAQLKGTLTEHKNELLFAKFGINYSHLPAQFRKGSTLLRKTCKVTVKVLDDGTPVQRSVSEVQVFHVDIICNEFWKSNADLLT